MVINHLPTEIRTFTDQSIGIFSAAEGFVFLSGLLAGWVYTRKYRTKGNDGLWAASTDRARSIYRWHVGSLLLAFVAVQATEHILGYCAPTVPRLLPERSNHIKRFSARAAFRNASTPFSDAEKEPN